MIKFSAVIISKNEEKNIERCISSLIGLADEIIVIDSYSTDKTKEICEKFNVRFIQTEWKGYSETKNFGNSLAKNENIISIDADEAISQDLKKAINELKSKDQIADAYIINRITNYCGSWIHHSGWYPDKKLRIWNKNKGKWEGMIHEIVKMNNNSSIHFLKGDLLHYSYYNLNDHIKQIKLFTDIMAQNNVKEGKKGSLFKIIFSPIFKFISSYLLKLGFLDGFAGFQIAVMSSYASFLKYAKTREIIKNEQ